MNVETALRGNSDGQSLTTTQNASNAAAAVLLEDNGDSTTHVAQLLARGGTGKLSSGGKVSTYACSMVWYCIFIMYVSKIVMVLP